MMTSRQLAPLGTEVGLDYYDYYYHYGRLFVKQLVCPILSDRCLSVCPVLSVCNVGVLWPNGWMDQGETRHMNRPRPRRPCVRWGPSPPKRGTVTIFGSCPLWPNGWMDEDATWYGGRPRPRRYCVRWGPSSPLKGAEPPVFGPCLLWSNGWMDEDATW